MRVILILLVMLANYTFAFAEISEPMTINIIENPVSLNITYEIERFVILKDKRIFIDSDDKNSITGKERSSNY